MPALDQDTQVKMQESAQLPKLLSGKITGIVDANSSKSVEAFICTCPRN